MPRRSSAELRSLRERVFREVFEAHFGRVVRYVERQTGHTGIAEDIASSVFEVAWRKLDPDNPFGLPWLIRTAMHKTRDYQRREYRGAAAVTALARLAEESPQELDELERLALNDALDKLQPKDREIIRLTYWDGLSASEIGAVLRMREGAIWTRLHRARTQLRDRLEETTTREVKSERRGAGKTSPTA